jgi:hypothetical protein
MRNGLMTGLLFVACLGAGPVWAQDNRANAETGRSATNAENMDRGALSAEAFSIKPEVGVMRYSNTTDGSSSTRGAAGLDIEFNLARFMSAGSPLYTGIQTGVVYSHMGSAGAGFFGTNSGISSTDPGANMLLIPANLKVGWNATDRMRISGHGGGNLIYRSVANAADFGGNNSGGANSVWRIFPTVGGDLDLGLAPGVSLMLRPDVTLTPGSTLFTGTLGLGISLG